MILHPEAAKAIVSDSRKPFGREGCCLFSLQCAQTRKEPLIGKPRVFEIVRL